MPLLMIKAPNAPQSLKPAPRPIDLQKLTATDPLDRETRDLAFLLDTRLYADGFIALRNGRVVAEQVLARNDISTSALPARRQPTAALAARSDGARSGQARGRPLGDPLRTGR